MIDLNDEWKLWYHSIKDTNWDMKSYKELYTIRNMYDYQIIKDTIENNIYQNGMFFYMKNNILPIWEIPENKNGSSISFKISRDIKKSIDILLLHIFKEIIYVKSTDISINGISISPKNSVIIKLWTNKIVKNLNDICIEILPFTSKNCIIKKT